ncbi:hypothetical protein WJX84_011312 [Apatococcus fuscideae]|uniref:Succinate dehydrogenase assembly factor 4, mitochondrial n=1 Tax=Apatococcus fuscideae TaxID=2026836 RepID=A0AAW1RR11_9CHLO
MLGAGRLRFVILVTRASQNVRSVPATQNGVAVRPFASGNDSSGIKPDSFLKKLQQIGLRELTEITSKYEGLRTDVRSKEEKEAEEAAEEDEADSDLNKSTGERGGPRGPEPTRYGDWSKGGRVSDF